MSDAHHYFGDDLQVSTTGDIRLADGIELGNQRVIRRLMTILSEYVWHPTYGASVPIRVGDVLDKPLLEAVIRTQIALEAAVAETPEPTIEVTPIFGGIFVSLRYTEALSGRQIDLEFEGGMMTALNLKTFGTLVDQGVAAVQGRAANLIDFSIGSTLRAIVEADGGLALWLQSRLLKVLAATRAATSTGDDLDTFIADFGLTRLGAQSSVGTVTFSRFTPGAQAVIPVGAEVQTADGSQRFAVTLDTANTAYNAGLGGYVLPVDVSSISLPVAAITAGSAGNVLAGTVSLISSSIDYVDTVINAADFAGGGEQESDDAVRARFRLFIASLSKATTLAIGFAILSQGLGLDYTLTEFELYDGTPKEAYFYAVIDDGSGAPSASLVTATTDIIEQTRAAGVAFAVFSPVVTTVTVSMTVTVLQGYDVNVVKGAVGTAITTYISALKLGEGLPYTKLAQIAYEAHAGVSKVNSVLLDGGVADAAPSNKVLLRPSTVTVS